MYNTKQIFNTGKNEYFFVTDDGNEDTALLFQKPYCFLNSH